MKKQFIPLKTFGFVIAIIQLITISCEKLKKDAPFQAVPKNNSPLENHLTARGDAYAHIDSIVALYSAVANQHNKALEYIYTKYKTKVDSSGTTPLGIVESSDLLGNVSQFLNDSLETRTISGTPVNFGPYYFIDSIAISPGCSDISLSDHVERITGNRPSSALENALTHLEALVKDSSLNRDSTRYNGLIQYYVYDGSMVDSDKITFTAAVKTGQNSIQYWTANLPRWDSLTANILGGVHRGNALARRSAEEILQDMAFADLAGLVAAIARAGAVCAAAGGLASIFIPGVGTVTGMTACALGGMVLGTVGGSAGAGFWGVIRNLIGW